MPHKGNKLCFGFTRLGISALLCFERSMEVTEVLGKFLSGEVMVCSSRARLISYLYLDGDPICTSMSILFMSPLRSYLDFYCSFAWAYIPCLSGPSSRAYKPIFFDINF